jgi:hypothetical protein
VIADPAADRDLSSVHRQFVQYGIFGDRGGQGRKEIAQGGSRGLELGLGCRQKSHTLEAGLPLTGLRSDMKAGGFLILAEAQLCAFAASGDSQ